MKHISTLLALSLFCVSAAACSDPEVAKRKHMEKGDALMAQGKAAEAALEYRNAIRQDRQFGEARFKLAEAHARNGNAQGAAQEYVRAADLMPDRPEVQMKAASVYLNSRQYEPAIKHADLALKANPKLVEAHLVRAHALAAQKETDAAIQELEDAMIATPLDSRLHTSLGGIRASIGNTAEAEKAFRRAVEIDPSSLPAKLALAYFLWTAERLPEAEAILTQALSVNQGDVGANRMMALLLLTQNRTQEAETPLLRLVNAKDGSSTITLADLYSRTGRGDQARVLYESLKENKRSRPTAVVRLASMDYTSGNRQRAHATLDEELKTSPEDPLLLNTKAMWLARDGRGTEAFDVATRSVAVAPNSADAQFVLGLAHAARGESIEAEAAFKEALRLNPKMTRAEVELSGLLLRRGDREQSLQHAMAARKAEPLNPEARFTVARALVAKNDLAAAETELKALRTEFPKSSGVHAMYGQLLQQKGDRAAAREAYSQALQLNPAEFNALRALVTLDIQLKKYDDAGAKMKAAVERAPDTAAVLILAAQVEHERGNMAAAEAHLKKAVESEPANAETYSQLARFYVGQKKLPEARTQLREFAKLRPDSVPTLTLLGMIEESQGLKDDAIATYENIVKGSNRAPVAANNLAYLYLERGVQLDMAVQLAQQAKQQLPDSPDVSDTLGWAYVKKGMPDMAIAPLEFSVSKSPDNVGYLYHLGMAYAKAGRADKARTTLDRALKLQPDFSGAAEAREALASLSK